jgi:16S rRNA (uracil1498-N3)-methyltransferase
MNSHLFRFLATKITKDSWEVTGAEFKHLSTVLRLSLDDQVEVFDGKGSWGQGKICEIQKNKKAMIQTFVNNFDEKSQKTFALAIGALKTSNAQELLPYITELGVDEIHMFLHQGVEKKRLSGKSKERYERIIISSCKQCKRSYLPKLFFWNTLEEFINYALDKFANKLLLNLNSPIITKSNLDSNNICVLIGSEKGLSKIEQEKIISAEFVPVSLGHTVLRATTTAISTVVLFRNNLL